MMNKAFKITYKSLVGIEYRRKYVVVVATSYEMAMDTFKKELGDYEILSCICIGNRVLIQA